MGKNPANFEPRREQLTCDLIVQEGSKNVRNHIDYLKKMLSKDEVNFFEVQKFIMELIPIYHQIPIKGKNELTVFLETCLKNRNDTNSRVFALSILIVLEGEDKYVDKLVDVIFEKHLPYYVKKFLYWQLVNLGVLKGIFPQNVPIKTIYKHVFDTYSNLLGIDIKYISAELRERKTVVVIIGQMLYLPHSPTRAVLGLIRIMIEKMGYNVILINEAAMPLQLYAPYINYSVANHVHDWDGWMEIAYKGNRFLRYQSSGSLGNLSEIEKMVKIIAEKNPFFIFNYGGSSIVSDLCGQFNDVVNLNSTDGLAVALGGFYLLPSNQLNGGIDPDNQIPKDKIITGSIYYESIDTKTKLKRSDYRIDERAFVLIVIGNRLDYEVDFEFMSFLEEMLREQSNMYVVFVGKFESYKQYANDFIYINSKSKFVGYQSELLSFYELCDVYINPKRSGGGFSAIDAMCKGVPVVTFPTGDVALASQYAWVANSYSEMKKVICEFLHNKEVAQAAKERAVSIGEFWKSGEGFVSTIKKIEGLILEADRKMENNDEL